MRETVETGLKAIETKLCKENIPIPVRLGFVEELRKVTQTNCGRKAWCCEHTDRAIRGQETLGSLAILRGHHHKEWAYAIAETYRPRTQQPGRPQKRDKTPLEMSVVLVEEVWNLFNSLWETRNEILHDENGPSKKSEDSQLLHQLLTYRRYRTRLLAPSDRKIIEYDISEIKTWIRIKKEEHWKSWTDAAINMKKKCKRR